MPDAGSRGAFLEQLPDRVRLPLGFDPALLTKALKDVTSRQWIAHFVPAHYSGDWSVLPLRGPAGASHPILQITSHPGTADWEDTDLLHGSPLFQQILSHFPCPLESVRLMRLAAGSRIHEHRDDDLNAAWGQARLHVPLATHRDVDFRLNNQPVTMAVGELWYLRLSDVHSVHNASPIDRVHLVIDAKVDDWLADQLFRGAGFSG